MGNVISTCTLTLPAARRADHRRWRLRLDALELAVPVVVALLAALGGWLVAARRLSGRIATSEAAELWKEAGAIRNDYRARLAMADERTRELEVRLRECEKQLRDWTP